MYLLNSFEPKHFRKPLKKAPSSIMQHWSALRNLYKCTDLRSLNGIPELCLAYNPPIMLLLYTDKVLLFLKPQVQMSDIFICWPRPPAKYKRMKETTTHNKNYLYPLWNSKPVSPHTSQHADLCRLVLPDLSALHPISVYGSWTKPKLPFLSFIHTERS